MDLEFMISNLELVDHDIKEFLKFSLSLKSHLGNKKVNPFFSFQKSNKKS